MKFLKLYEDFGPGGRRNVILYKCKKFKIEHNENNAFCATTKSSQQGAISYMAELIHDNSEKLDDPKLREVPVRPIDIYSELNYLDLNPKIQGVLQPGKIENIKHFRSGFMNHFWGDKYNKNLPIDIFMEFLLKYYPIIEDAIRDNVLLNLYVDYLEKKNSENEVV